MDIGGVYKFKPIIPPRERPEIERNKESEADRDANGRQQREAQPQIDHLSTEQEEKALEKLSSQESFVRAGLKAELVREEGKHPHILIRKGNGEVIRRLPYSQIISILMNNESKEGSGLLINQKA